jgi:signal transduction histidine kinase
LLKGKNLRVRTEHGDQNTWAVFDRHHMIQVLVNLVSNAIKFSATGSEISIELSEERLPGAEPGLRCRVVDQGPGIPESELKAVFDKFIQSSKTKTGAGGTGLGLAICQNIIESHGGRIWAENAKPMGAIFTFVIPRSGRPAPSVMAPGEA